MKVAILAGGFGTRLAEETTVIPKPMIEIGGYPILWHIMKIYASQGYDEFCVALGYKSEVIKRYFYDYNRIAGSLTVDMRTGAIMPLDEPASTWRIHLIETGLQSNTGGRVGRLRRYIGDETFMLTYGDGVGDIDVRALLDFHRSHGRLATVTAVRPPSRFGGIALGDGGEVTTFIEKPQIGEGWINGGYMVLEPQVFDYISGDDVSLESGVLERLAEEGQLCAYRHASFWQCMDTLRDKRQLEQHWESGKAPWRVW